MSFADNLGEPGRKRARLYAYGACLFGCISEVMLDTSAIIILFIQMLGGNDMVMMAVNSFSGLLSMLCMIPCVMVISRIGLKVAVRYACFTGCTGFVLMATAPFFGSFSCVVAVAGCFIYCLQRSLYGAAWYPLLDTFLRPEDRGKFFGSLRFMYYTFTGVLFFLIGLVMGKNPPVWLMQGVIGITGILLLGRYYCIAKFPDDPDAVRENSNFREAMRTAICNGPLTAYSVYLCLFTMSITSIVPLTFIYLSKYVGMEPGQIQMISAFSMLGSISGFFFYNRLLRRFGIKKLELAVHIFYIIAGFTMFALNCRMPGFTYVVAGLLCMLAFSGSIFGCNNSGEMLALARPGNKTMATSFVQTYGAFGGFAGRGGVSLVLGATMLAPVWHLGEMEISRYQTIFLFSAVLCAVVLLLTPTLPSVVPKHDDYYEPTR